MNKKILSLSLILAASMLITALQSIAQNRQAGYAVGHKAKRSVVVKPAFHKFESNHPKQNISAPSGRQDGAKSFTDTLNFPLAGDQVVYLSESGYVSGNNEYGDLAKANFFQNSHELSISGVLMDFAVATGSGEDIEIAVWNSNGADNSPGTKMASEMIPLSDIVNDVMNNQTNYIPFTSPVSATSSFYVGVMLPQMPGDTLALWTNTDGDTNPTTAWELWDSNEWYDYAYSWGLNVSHAIFPIVTYNADLISDFTADPTQIAVGSSVSFTDMSIGNTVSWMWEFPGGNPAQSTAQNPTVTYNSIGSYDVKLKVGNGSISDSITKPGFITVTDMPQLTIDTLNYPLPGSHILYLYNGGGYVCGTNSEGDLAKANFFQNNMQGKISGILFEFVRASGGNPDVEVNVWNENGNGEPGTIMGTSTIALNAIKDNVNAQELTYLAFNPPIQITGSFFAGFNIPQNSGDTLVVWSNNDGDTNPGIAWEEWSDMNWYAMNQAPSYGINIAMAIHPIVDYTIGIDDNLAKGGYKIFPNPSEGILHLSFNSSSPENIEVFNVNRKLVTRISQAGRYDEISIDLSDQPVGIYFLKIVSEKGISVEKIVKK